MSYITIPFTSQSRIIEFPIYDSSSIVGAMLGGLVYNSTGLTCKYHRDGAGSWVTTALTTMTIDSWSSGGFVISDVAGIYQLGIPNAALVAGANYLTIRLLGATNMVPVIMTVQLQ